MKQVIALLVADAVITASALFTNDRLIGQMMFLSVMIISVGILIIVCRPKR